MAIGEDYRTTAPIGAHLAEPITRRIGDANRGYAALIDRGATALTRNVVTPAMAPDRRTSTTW